MQKGTPDNYDNLADAREEPDAPGAGGIVLRGFLMGIAEVVPGVSGGTIALVTGIYQRLVSSIASFGPASVPMLLHWREFVRHHQLSFLLLLALGMGLGIALFAQLMKFLLANYQPVVWAFFSGVIGMSVLVIGASRTRTALLTWGVAGVLLGVSMLWLPQVSVQPSPMQVFFAGALAICAWLLPAVSGSFVLLALGLYAAVIDAVAGFDVLFVLTFGLGCAAGLLTFSRLLAWLLQRHSDALLSLLTGVMLGSLTKLWPWQSTQASGWDILLTPEQYVLVQNAPAYIVWVVFFVITGAVGLWALSKFTSR